jgi:hypothetical protein
MKDFETKAKTTEEIEGISAQAVADFKYKNLHWKAKDKIRNQKWVPLRDAQKCDEARLSYIKILEDDLKQKKAKLDKANKIFDDWESRKIGLSINMNELREALK